MFKYLQLTKRVRLFAEWDEDADTLSITPAIVLDRVDNYAEIAFGWALSIDFLKGAIGIEWRRH